MRFFICSSCRTSSEPDSCPIGFQINRHTGICEGTHFYIPMLQIDTVSNVQFVSTIHAVHLLFDD